MKESRGLDGEREFFDVYTTYVFGFAGTGNEKCVCKMYAFGFAGTGKVGGMVGLGGGWPKKPTLIELSHTSK